MPRLEDLTQEQRDELAASYLSLLDQMNDALIACETGYGFFSWLPGRVGYRITGHPPDDLVERLRGL